MAHKTRELRSTVSKDGVLTLSLAEIVLDDPASDEIIVRVEAAPINPSDLGLLLGSANAASVRKGVSCPIWTPHSGLTKSLCTMQKRTNGEHVQV